MEEVKAEAPPEPQITHYERRNNVMLEVYDIGPVRTHRVCASINEAKRLSRILQSSGKKVKVDHTVDNVHKPVRRHKVITKSQSVKKTLRAGPRLTEDEAKALERHLLRRAAK